MTLTISQVSNGESGASVRAKLNALFAAVSGGTFQSTTDADAFIAAILLRVAEAETQADAVNDAVVATNARIAAVEAIVDAFGTDVLDRAEALVDQLSAFDPTALSKLLGLAIAGQRDGWAVDPKFQTWESGAPKFWTAIGANFMHQDEAGTYLSSVAFDIPTGAAAVSLTAASNVAGQLSGVDLSHQYVAVSVLLKAISGSLAGSEIRAEWLSGSTWVRGDAFGTTAALGNLATQWGFTVDANSFNSRTIIFKRPVAATALRIVAKLKQASPANGVAGRLDCLDVRGLTEAEVLATAANGYADAKVSNLSFQILDPGTGALAAAVAAVRAEFAANLATVNTTITTLSTSVSSQASRITTLEAGLNSANLVKNPRFSDGVRAAGVVPNNWQTWPASYSVKAAGAGTTFPALTNAPTPFVGSVASGTTLEIARVFVGQPCKPTDSFSASIRLAGGGTGINVTFGFSIVWKDVLGVQIGATVDIRGATLTSTAWAQFDFNDYVAPAGAASFEFNVRRFPNGNGTVFFTDVSLTQLNTSVTALITQAQAAAATAQAGVATINQTATASFGSFSAFVSATQTAVATMDGASSALVFRNLGASIGLYAWDNKTGVGGAIKLDGAMVIAPGTLGAGQITVGDYRYNMVPDNQLYSQTAWDCGPEFTFRPRTSESFDSVNEIRYGWTAGTGLTYAIGRPFPVPAAGSLLNCSFQARRISGIGQTFTLAGRIQWQDATGAVIADHATDPIATISGTATGTQTGSGDVTVPTGAATALFYFRIDKSTTDCNVAMGSPSVIHKTDASVLITPDGAFMNQLTAKTAWIVQANIANAAVGTLQIAGNAVTVPVFASRTADLLINDGAGFTNILDFNCTMSQAGLLMANASVAYDLTATAANTTVLQSDISWRLLIDGTVVFDCITSSQQSVVPLCGALSVSAGTVRIQVQGNGAVVSSIGIRNNIRRAACWGIGAKR